MIEGMPQEIEVRYILPAIRKELARVFVREKNLSQKQTAKLLDVTDAAISQYLSDKRGNEVVFTEGIISEIRISADRIISDKSKTNLIGEIYRISNLTNVRQILCDIHRSQSKELENCNVCFEVESSNIKLKI